MVNLFQAGPTKLHNSKCVMLILVSNKKNVCLIVQKWIAIFNLDK